ncbi:MAG: DUF1289 domain-containing protein [Pseudomonadota bacterium]
MTDDIWRRENVPSPCVKICLIHPAERICTGCLRTIDEIGAWSRLSDDARKAIMAELPARAPRLTRRRGGRKTRMGG